MNHGMPSPRKTLTEFEPVMLPIELSAYFSFCAAIRLANVSGSDVPSATIVMAVIAGFEAEAAADERRDVADQPA